MCLLPDDDCLEQHIKLANFLASIRCHRDLRIHLSYRSWLGISEWLLQTVRHTKSAVPRLLPVSPIQQDQYNSDSEANSEAEDEAACYSDFDSESSTELELSDEH